MKQNTSIWKKIDDFSSDSLYERTTVRIPLHNTVIVPSQGNEICRIIHSANRTFVSVQEKHIQTIREYIRVNDIAKNFALRYSIEKYSSCWAIILASFYWSQAKSFCRISNTTVFILWTTLVLRILLSQKAPTKLRRFVEETNDLFLMKILMIQCIV